MLIALNFEPPKAISTFNFSNISGKSRMLCECITQFSAYSLENLKELEKSVSLILKGLWKVNAADLSSLEVLLVEFFKNHRDYDVENLSSSQKIMRDTHQEWLSIAQQHLHAATEDKFKMQKHRESFKMSLRELKKS